MKNTFLAKSDVFYLEAKYWFAFVPKIEVVNWI